MNLFPAVLLGGPPHAGKSVLSYSLSQALRVLGVQHYVLRAAPDGEGDFSNEADPETVRTIRFKTTFTSSFVEHVCRSLARRHLPLLVDVGGKPTPEQEIIFDQCTHAILLYKEEADLDSWRAIVERHNLIVIAELHSILGAPESITDSGPILRGVAGGLRRGSLASGSLIAALTQRLAGLFAYTPDEIIAIHLRAAPVENVCVVEEHAATMGIPTVGANYRWQPEHLPKLLERLPAAQPLAAYGRGPIWLYAALAAHAYPASFWQFDVRLGWTESLTLQSGEMPPDAPLHVESLPGVDRVRLEFRVPSAYLDYEQAGDLRIPEVPHTQGVILSGKLPNWLWTSLVIAYHGAAWVAVNYPQHDKAIVVYRSHAGGPAIGSLV
jgi:CRISPR-associated protein Csx3